MLRVARMAASVTVRCRIDGRFEQQDWAGNDTEPAHSTDLVAAAPLGRFEQIERCCDLRECLVTALHLSFSFIKLFLEHKN
ncbi:hypothetical protein [Psychromarinibacter sp. S121]|uniref:hypothetical protein n=1 Tax=Psychromarinibacter sp. S121 TaxID=3415127 RepID=UPI003C7A4823